MSIVTEGASCVRCKSYLFAEDDVVYCPICGAPHHRECYSALGHCALEELHGTENEYKPPVQKEQTPEDNPSASVEDATDNADFLRNNGFMVFDLLGGVPADYKFDENVTANDAKKFVVANTHRYIPKFTVLSKENKTSWNWASFLFPGTWMISRKMYKSGIICGIIYVIASLLTLPMSIAVKNLGIVASSYIELANAITDNISLIGIPALCLAFISFIISILLRIICGIFSDYWYKNHTVSCIKKIKKSSDDLDLNYRKFGGVNILLFFITTLILEYLPVIVMSIIV